MLDSTLYAAMLQAPNCFGPNGSVFEHCCLSFGNGRREARKGLYLMIAVDLGRYLKDCLLYIDMPVHYLSTSETISHLEVV